MPICDFMLKPTHTYWRRADYLDTNGDLTGPWTVNAETDGQGNITKLEVSDGWAADAVEKATKKDAGGYTIVAKVETTDVTKK